MRALLLGGLLLAVACQRTPETQAPPSASVAPAPTPANRASSVPTSCPEIKRELHKQQARLAKQPQRCEVDSDCELYGGHECPNPLVQVCPDAVAKASARVLRPLEDAWEHQQCGEILWSPYHREAVCHAGLCAGR